MCVCVIITLVTPLYPVCICVGGCAVESNDTIEQLRKELDKERKAASEKPVKLEHSKNKLMEQEKKELAMLEVRTKTLRAKIVTLKSEVNILCIYIYI